MSSSVAIERHKIPDGWVLLDKVETRNWEQSDSIEWRVYTIRGGNENKGRYYVDRKTAERRFGEIVAAHTPPEGYTPPLEPPRPEGWGRFG